MTTSSPAMHRLSPSDREFKNRVERAIVSVADFDHRAHLRLAYIYLTENTPEAAVDRMRDALLGLLASAGIDPTIKFHETLTQAWVLAVHHFMQHSQQTESASDFIGAYPQLLDSRLMLTHYSPERLFSDKARAHFVAPDRQAIPG